MKIMGQASHFWRMLLRMGKNFFVTALTECDRIFYIKFLGGFQKIKLLFLIMAHGNYGVLGYLLYTERNFTILGSTVFVYDGLTSRQ